ncbi:pentatricopeptide repeat-containing protein At3g46610-like [Chenopodium quinoa]|uniref:PROP1-like PPR domain-containing protein n=1 Tax=Chenopodium quinoa TaxID=63459 RepID=A0A803MVS1_CHEQI|nr:pentatricopeptide repeat-containing protein At3g46610-like [Chenopodium quinoa]
MQTLSVWPLRGELLEVPQLEFQLGFTSFGRIRSRIIRRKNLGRIDSIVHLRRSSRHSRSDFDDIGVRVFFKCDKIKLFLSGESRSLSGLCFPVGWALEEQAIGNSVINEDLEEIDELKETRLEKDDGELCLSKSIGSGDDVGGEIRDGGEVEEEEMDRRVDVRGLAQCLLQAQSVEDVEEIMKDEDKVPLQVFSSIISGFGREKRLEPAMAVVDWLKMKCEEGEDAYCPNLYIYNSLLSVVKQSGELDKVDMVLSEMDEVGISRNVVTYNTLMGIYLEEGRTAEALNLFEDIKCKGLSPSPPSFSTALLAYRRMEDGIGALNFFIALREKYMSGELKIDGHIDWHYEYLKLKNFTSRICYQIMRRWLVKDGNFTTNVLKLLIEMDKAALPPTREEYERLIWACTREEHYTVAKELYNRIRENHSDISLSVCNHIIWLMGKAKKWWAALEIYEDMLDKGPKPNNMAYELIVSHFNVLLSAARKRGIWRWGLKLLDKMEAKGLKPRSREWNAVLIACSKASEATAAVEIFKRMIERGEKPTVISYGALLSALEKGKLYDEAVRVWEHMRKIGVEPNLYAYTIMASVYVGLGKFNLVDYIIQEMVSIGINPTVVTFNAIISVCTKNGLVGAAYEWFQRMRSMSIDPNEITYDTLIEALANDGKPRLAYDLYLSALNEDLKPSSKAYDAILQSSRTLGATIDISALGPRPPEKKKKVPTKKNQSESGTVIDLHSQSNSFVREETHAQEAA